MSSSVYYKFKSQRQESRVTFDGTGISVFDLKKEILLQNNLKGNDFDLFLYDNTEQEFKDDSYIIPRSTSVIAKRMPAPKGKGRAAMYVAHVGTASNNKHEDFGATAGGGSAPVGGVSTGGRFGAMSKRFDGKDIKQPHPPSGPTSSSNTPQPQSAPAPVVAPAGAEDEAASIAAMFAETSEQWEQTQERMAHSKPVYTPRNFGNNRGGYSGGQQQQRHHQPDTRPLPPGYICHRCNKKGHWIQDCPTNDDRDYDNRPRVKRTTGIPRSFLKAVDVTEGPPTKGVMVTPEGGFVIAEPDSAAWERQRVKPKGLTEAEVKDRAPRDTALACPYPGCGKLLRDAVKTPCCHTLYCEECVHTHLLDRNFECPKCGRRIPSLDKLKIDSDTRAKVREYVRNAVEDSRREAEEAAVAANPPAKKVTPPPEAPKDEEYSEHQPGNENGGDQAAFMDPNTRVTHLQASLAQLMMMQSNPVLAPATRINVNTQIQQRTFELQQAEAIRDMFNMGMNMPNGMAMMNNMMAMGGPMMGGGMGQMNMNQGYHHQPPQMQQQQWNNGYHMQQGGVQGPYDRLPVNNRRGKRELPDDFDGAPNAKRQYWE